MDEPRQTDTKPGWQAPTPTPLIRGPRRGDQAYVASTLTRQLADVDRDYSAGKRWGQAGVHVDMVLDRPDTRLRVCHSPADPAFIWGWVMYSEVPGVPVLQFVYVRRAERQKGIGTALLESIGIRRDSVFVYTFQGPSTPLMRTKYRLATHMPVARFLGLPSAV